MNKEAARCLLCPKAKCKEACPVHTDVPSCMNLYRKGKLLEAGKILFENNPLSAFTSRICDFDRFCRGHCVLNAKNDPIHWHEIEQEISRSYLKKCHFEKPLTTSKRIAICGGGPAGIVSSILLAQKGYQITLYEAKERIGGLLRYGIPEFRLEKDDLDEIERIINELGIQVQNHTWIGKDVLIEDLAKEYDAVLVATGAMESRKLRIEGEEKAHVIPALEYLMEPEEYPLGDKVIVIGGGNVAIDASRSAKRAGKEVSIYYRKTFENMPANPTEIEAAKQEDILFEVFVAPVEVKEHSVIFRRCENVFDEKGRIQTKIIDGTDFEVACDSLLVAAGETVNQEIFKEMPSLNEWGWIDVNESGQTSIENIFLAGDFHLGASTVVQTIANAKETVQGILNYLEGE